MYWDWKSEIESFSVSAVVGIFSIGKKCCNQLTKSYQKRSNECKEELLRSFLNSSIFHILKGWKFWIFPLWHLDAKELMFYRCSSSCMDLTSSTLIMYVIFVKDLHSKELCCQLQEVILINFRFPYAEPSKNIRFSVELSLCGMDWNMELYAVKPSTNLKTVWLKSGMTTRIYSSIHFRIERFAHCNINIM